MTSSRSRSSRAPAHPARPSPSSGPRIPPGTRTSGTPPTGRAHSKSLPQRKGRTPPVSQETGGVPVPHHARCRRCWHSSCVTTCEPVGQRIRPPAGNGATSERMTSVSDNERNRGGGDTAHHLHGKDNRSAEDASHGQPRPDEASAG